MNKAKVNYSLIAILLSVVLILGLSHSIPVFGDDPSIEKLTDVTLGPLTSDNYDIKKGALVGALTSNQGTVTVNYEDSAELKVSIDSTQVPSWVNPSKLEIKLGDKDWKVLGDNTISLSLGGEGENWDEEVNYELRYDVNDQSTVPPPGSYLIGLDLSLSQTGGGCYDPAIEITSNELGPGELFKLKLTSSCGSVGNADVDSSNKDDYTKPNGKANLGQQPEGDISFSVGADGLENLNGDLDFSFDGDSLWGDLRVYVLGNIGPGREVDLKVEDKNGDPVEDVDVSGSFGGTTDSNGVFSFTFPSGQDTDVALTVDPNGQQASLQFDYDFDQYEP